MKVEENMQVESNIVAFSAMANGANFYGLGGNAAVLLKKLDFATVPGAVAGTGYATREDNGVILSFPDSTAFPMVAFKAIPVEQA